MPISANLGYFNRLLTSGFHLDFPLSYDETHAGLSFPS